MSRAVGTYGMLRSAMSLSSRSVIWKVNQCGVRLVILPSQPLATGPSVGSGLKQSSALRCSDTGCP